MNPKLWRCVNGLRWTALAALVWCVATPVWAQSPKIVQIEEHWELSVGEPDAPVSAPQATMVMSPQANLECQYFVFTINHRSVPAYEPGGMQVQLWSGDEPVDAESFAAGPLNQTNDVVAWVQRLKVENGTLSFEVVDGSSTSWGSFGGAGSLASSSPTTLDGLNGYSPGISLGESQIGYAGNRVQHLLLKKLVWVTDDGETHELQAPINIDATIAP